MSSSIIFDLDGTLVDSCPMCVSILEEMLRERGSARCIDPKVARGFLSKGGRDMVQGLLGKFCRDPDRDLAEFRARYAGRKTSKEALFPGVSEGLKALYASGFILALCSNKPQNLCAQVLADTGLAHMFEVVIGGRDGRRGKPAPDLLEDCMVALGGKARNAVYVGDSELDHAVATAAGMPFLFMTYGYAQPGWSAPGSLTFDCFSTLAEAILSRVTFDTRAQVYP